MTITKATNKLTQWRFRMYQFKLDMFCHDVIKHQVNDGLWHLKTKYDHKAES